MAVPTAGFLILAGATVAAIVHDSDPSVAESSSTTGSAPTFSAVPAEEPTVTRGEARKPLADPRVHPEVIGTRVALVDGVSVRTAPQDGARVVGTLRRGDRVDVTGRVRGPWSEVVSRDLSRWVRSGSIARNLPLGSQPCAAGSAVETGLQPDTVKVHRAVCAQFPQIAQYGGTSGSGEHATGQALDIMVTGELGNQVAAFLQEHRAELGIDYLIWQQRIWRPATAPSWRPMSDRGSPTANHMDHVHVTTYGAAAQ